MALRAINGTAIKFWHNIAFQKASTSMDIKQASRKSILSLHFPFNVCILRDRFTSTGTGLSLWNVQKKVSLWQSFWGWSDSNLSTCSENKGKVWVTWPIIKYHTQTRWQKDGDLQRDPPLNTAVLFLLYSEESSYKCCCCQISKHLSSVDCLLSESCCQSHLYNTQLQGWHVLGWCISPRVPIQRLCPCASSKQAKQLLLQLDIKFTTKQLSIKKCQSVGINSCLATCQFWFNRGNLLLSSGISDKKHTAHFIPECPWVSVLIQHHPPTPLQTPALLTCLGTF